jgi:acetyl esterase/lipase
MHFTTDFLIQLILCLALCASVSAQQPQNPSPMVEHTRAHPRLKQEALPGRRETLELGTLFVPAKLKLRSKLPLFVHFHGGTWLPEMAAATEGRRAVFCADWSRFGSIR